MAPDAYSLCPCGSGKKFKWCCLPIHSEVHQAFEQHEAGQHEAALRLMEDVVAKHPENAEAWGRRAQLLFDNNRVHEAEGALEKAFSLNQNYPFGLFLAGTMRQEEGDMLGALQFYRRANQFYDSDAKDALGQVQALIVQCELALNRPVAACAALRVAIHYRPTDEDLRQTKNALCGDKSSLPTAARRDYGFESPGSDANRQWPQSLEQWLAVRGDLLRAIELFEKATAELPDEKATWFNLGLSLAWQGENTRAIDALDRYLTLEHDEDRAALAWALAEVLRFGFGLEDLSDNVEYSRTYQIAEPKPVERFFHDLHKQHRLIVSKPPEDQPMISGWILEKLPDYTQALARLQAPHLSAYFLIAADRLRIWHTCTSRLQNTAQELENQVGSALTSCQSHHATANFQDILAEALVVPVNAPDDHEAKQQIESALATFFEQTWIHRPLHSLGLIPPIDAVGHSTLRKKVKGLIQFLQECAATNESLTYDFQRLRRKLGLLEAQPARVSIGVAASEIELMAAAELTTLDLQALSADALETAFQTALKLDAQDLAVRFAQRLIALPGQRDRFPWYAHLVKTATFNRDFDKAIEYINEGQRTDQAHNQGHHNIDFELRRAQVDIKRGELDQGQAIFDRLIGASPDDLRLTTSATEAMLSANEAARALRYARQGLAKARQRKDGDSEAHFRELISAADRSAAHSKT
jgi:tetratricopeptide (TPR) repeat protein